MDADEMLALATHYRMLATHLTDDQTRAGLLALAEKYEALAREMQGDNGPPTAP
jgi:hypothetical protein